MIILLIGESGTGKTTFQSRVFNYAEGTIKRVDQLDAKKFVDENLGDIINSGHQITWVFEMQSYKGVPPVIRKNADYIIFMSRKSLNGYFGKNPDDIDFNMRVMNACQNVFVNYVKVVYDVKRDMFSLDVATL